MKSSSLSNNIVGIDLDNSLVREYWQPLDIIDPVDRLDYIVNNIPLAIIRGPLIEMSLMMVTQGEMIGSTSRGTMFDSLHTTYCYYADNTVSNDLHFTTLKDHANVEFFERIVPADKYVELLKASYEKLTNTYT